VYLNDRNSDRALNAVRVNSVIRDSDDVQRVPFVTRVRRLFTIPFNYLGQKFSVYFCINIGNTIIWPIPLAAGSKVYVYGHSPAQIVNSNPAGGMDVCEL